MNPRVVSLTTVKGVFGLPIGVKFRQREAGELIRSVTVSTVCLEDGHLEDPLRICAPEHGYETMVFLDDCSLFSVFTENYETRAEAKRGHRTAVKKLLSGTLPLAIQIGHYTAFESESVHN